ncbi:hypothetical protein Ciccas_008043 [Cichlidogyrus casuarinus]|uniref:Uncharacterized protein n=1 Tax=Cichlidogyrus casuarinus TaxID=1844966 RepID=A0ABD2Q2B4_9PLAT
MGCIGSKLSKASEPDIQKRVDSDTVTSGAVSTAHDAEPTVATIVEDSEAEAVAESQNSNCKIFKVQEQPSSENSISDKSKPRLINISIEIDPSRASYSQK